MFCLFKVIIWHADRMTVGTGWWCRPVGYGTGCSQASFLERLLQWRSRLAICFWLNRWRLLDMDSRELWQIYAWVCFEIFAVFQNNEQNEWQTLQHDFLFLLKMHRLQQTGRPCCNMQVYCVGYIIYRTDLNTLPSDIDWKYFNFASYVKRPLEQLWLRSHAALSKILYATFGRMPDLSWERLPCVSNYSLDSINNIPFFLSYVRIT